MRVFGLALLPLSVLPLGCTASADASHDLSGAALAAGAGSGKTAEAQNQVAVRFGSYAMGIDHTAAARIEEILASDPAIRKVERIGPGREGEYLLRIDAGSAANARRLQERLIAVVPAKPRGPITVEGPLGELKRPSS